MPLSTHQGACLQDLKPGNVLIRREDDGTSTALIADFGMDSASGPSTDTSIIAKRQCKLILDALSKADADQSAVLAEHNVSEDELKVSCQHHTRLGDAPRINKLWKSVFGETLPCTLTGILPKRTCRKALKSLLEAKTSDLQKQAAVLLQHSQGAVRCDEKTLRSSCQYHISTGSAPGLEKLLHKVYGVDSLAQQSSTLESARPPSSGSGGWVGTYQYMAPECTGLNALKDFKYGYLGQPADVFSFGLVMWELYTRDAKWYSDRTLAEVFVSKSGKEDRAVARNFETPGGLWSQDMRSVAKWYYNGERPNFADDFPPKLKLLIEGCWAQRQEDRLVFGEVVKALQLEEIPWLEKATLEPEPEPEPEPTYVDFLSRLGFLDKKDALADCGLDEGLELLQLAEYDEDEFDEDVIDDADLNLDDEAKESFRAAVAALKTKRTEKAQKVEADGKEAKRKAKRAAKQAGSAARDAVVKMLPVEGDAASLAASLAAQETLEAEVREKDEALAGKDEALAGKDETLAELRQKLERQAELLAGFEQVPPASATGD